MLFSEFLKESVVTKQGVVWLNEGITHIEDLPPDQFVNAVRNLSKMIATEKLDGSNLTAGFDSEGRFYTSREAKGGSDRFYSTSDYSNSAADNGFKSAHAALQKIAPKLKRIVESGEAFEIEVLFGRQPNAIVYGANYVAFLRMVPGDNGEMPDQSKIKRLDKELKNDKVTINVPIVTTKDGINLTVEDQKMEWKFTSTSFVESHHFERVDVKKELAEFEQWLEQNPPSSFKTKKAFLDATQQFTLPIKEKFLDAVIRSLKPALRDVDVTSSEDIGVEGIVILDPQTGQQTKIVDKSIFTLINQFNFAIRNQIRKGGHWDPEKNKHLFKTFEASLGRDGVSIYDDMLEKIANVIGIPALGRYLQITRTIKKYDSPEAFIKDWKVKSVQQAKSGILSAIQEGLNDLEQGRNKFDKEWKNYKLTLQSGREIQYTDEIHNRTMMVFAETRQELQRMANDVGNAKTLADIANALYGKQLKNIR